VIECGSRVRGLRVRAHEPRLPTRSLLRRRKRLRARQRAAGQPRAGYRPRSWHHRHAER
jgi:hypothetical protein